MIFRIFFIVMVSLWVTLWSRDLFAGDYRLSTPLGLNYEEGLLPGQLDQYSLQGNSSVRLLVGYFEGKDFLSELTSMSDSEIQAKLLLNNKEMDVTGYGYERHIQEFKVIRSKTEFRIYIKLKSSRNAEEHYMIDSYLIRQGSSAIATAYYSTTLDQEISNELDRATKTIEITSGDSAKSNHPSQIENGSEFVYSRHQKKISLFAAITNKFWNGTDALASDGGQCSAVDKTYVIRGSYSAVPGSALFNFEKLSEDLIDAVASNSTSVDCLATQAKLAITNASEYWAQRGIREHCLNDDGISPVAAPPNCSSSTFAEMKKSLTFLDKTKTRLNNALEQMASPEGAGASCGNRKEPNGTISNALAAATTIQQRFCCEPKGEGGSEPGPLMSALEGDDKEFKASNESAKINICLRKTIGDNSKNLISAEGAGDCATNLGKTFGNQLGSMVTGMTSIFSWDSVKAIANLANPFDSSSRDALIKFINEVGKQIAAEVYSVTDCLGPYEKQQYLCKMTGDVLGLFLGPALIGKVVKLIATMAKSGGRVTGINGLIKEVAGKPPLKTAIDVSKQAGKKAKEFTKSKIKPLRDSAAFKLTAKAAIRTAKIIGKDISTPMKDLVAKSARRITSEGLQSAKSAGSKIANAASGIRTGSKVKSLVGEIQPQAVAKNSSKASSTAKVGDGVELSTITASPSNYKYQQVKPDSSFIKNKSLQKKMRNMDIVPKHEYSLPSGDKMTVGNPFEFDKIEGRKFVVVNYETRAGNKASAVYYQSKSSGVFRHAPGIGENGYLSKTMFGENMLSAPPAMQQALNDLVNKSGPLKRYRGDFADLNHANSEVAKFEHYDINLGFKKVNVKPITDEVAPTVKSPKSGREAKFASPEKIKFKDPSLEPDFSKPIANYDVKDSIYGSLKAEVYQSKNGELSFTVMRTADDKAYISSVSTNQGRTLPSGLNAEFPEAKALTMPLGEYSSQRPIGFSTNHSVYGDYHSTWDYIREMPVIKDYYKTRGIKLPNSLASAEKTTQASGLESQLGQKMDTMLSSVDFEVSASSPMSAASKSREHDLMQTLKAMAEQKKLPTNADNVAKMKDLNMKALQTISAELSEKGISYRVIDPSKEKGLEITESLRNVKDTIAKMDERMLETYKKMRADMAETARTASSNNETWNKQLSVIDKKITDLEEKIKNKTNPKTGIVEDTQPIAENGIMQNMQNWLNPYIVITESSTNPKMLNNIIRKYKTDIVLSPNFKSLNADTLGGVIAGDRPLFIYPIEQVFTNDKMLNGTTLHEVRHLMFEQLRKKGIETPYNIQIKSKKGSVLNEQKEFYDTYMSFEELSTWNRDLSYAQSKILGETKKRAYSMDKGVLIQNDAVTTQVRTAAGLSILSNAADRSVQSALRYLDSADAKNLKFVFKGTNSNPTSSVVIPYFVDGKQVGDMTVQLVKLNSENKDQAMKMLREYLFEAKKTIMKHSENAAAVLKAHPEIDPKNGWIAAPPN